MVLFSKFCKFLTVQKSSPLLSRKDENVQVNLKRTNSAFTIFYLPYIIFLHSILLVEGKRYVECRAVHKGRSTIVNQVEITAEYEKLVSVGNYTMFLLQKIEDDEPLENGSHRV